MITLGSQTLELLQAPSLNRERGKPNMYVKEAIGKYRGEIYFGSI